MNILFVLYGDFGSNSANPLVLYTRELSHLGHSCVVAVPHNLETVAQHENPSFRPILYVDALADPTSVFLDGRPADVIHAWTCRETVRRFVTAYLAQQPTPLVIYLEDNELWISLRALGLDEDSVNRHTEREISDQLPDTLSHPLYLDSFIGLADAVAVIQSKLKVFVQPWVSCETVMIGVDLDFFSPRPPDPALRAKYGVAENERVIVYHGGLNNFVKPALETLCWAVGLINKQGYPCRLLRTGPFPLHFLNQFPPDIASVISDLGVLPKHDLPDLLALSEVFVQPGQIDPFEDLRLPGKIPEFLAMGRPVVMPDVNIAHLFSDGVNAAILRNGSAEEIADKCIELFSDPTRADKIGRAGRQMAKKYFDAKSQAQRFEKVYQTACKNFNPIQAEKIWRPPDGNIPITLRLARKLRFGAHSSNGKSKYEASDILKEYGRYIELMHQRVKGLETGIILLHQQIDERVSHLKHQIVRRGGQIVLLNQQIAERDAQLALLHHQFIERGGQVGRLEQQVAERDAQITGLYRKVRERDVQLTSLHHQFIERGGQVARLEQQVAERDAQIIGLHGKVGERDALLADIVASKSWRVTHPIRLVAHQWRKIGQRLRLLLTLLKGSGGMVISIKKTMAAFGADGVSGIRNRMRNKISGSGVISIPQDESSKAVSIDRNDYTEWVRRYDTMTEGTRSVMRQRIGRMSQTSLISVLMPTYNTEPQWLIEAIESVRRQIYPHWELCIVDDASTDRVIRALLEGYAMEEPRIKVVFREKNGHISAASNDALKLVTGEWVALLDHDDLLAEHALFWVADAINQHPQARLIYSDEDKINEKGKRFQPYFKCDWNVDLFYSHNLITHLGVYRTDLVREIGGFREGFEGAQDYDLALRSVEKIALHEIHHIPRVLYHWRVHNESTAQALTAKPYALLAGERALNEHLQRQGVKATAKLVGHGYRVSYALPEDPPMVSLIIPTRNGVHLLTQCVDSILQKTLYPNYEILIVDNGSDEREAVRYLKSLKYEPRVRILREDGPFNFSALNNAAVKKAQGSLVGLINNDITVISPDWLSEMVSLALQPKIGAVGASLWYPNNTLQHGGVILGIGGVAGHSHKGYPKGSHGYFSRMSLLSSFSALTAACLIIEKAIYEQVGGFNETDLHVAFNDTDFCLRVREAGYRNVWTPYAELYHHESATRGFEDIPEKQVRFAKEIQYMNHRWKDSLFHDPAYSPNLTLDYEDFSLAWPPRVNPPDSLFFSDEEEGPSSSELSRLDKVMSMIDRNGLGLEIRPGLEPLAPKRQGFNVHILDHFTTEELRAKNQGQGTNLDDIEEVDYVWRGEPLHELIGQEQCYDWIIACHVIEHIPDLISFLAECEKLLKPIGVLSLIIPDKRYCFDYFHGTTSTGELLDAFDQKRLCPSPGKVFDHSARAVKCNGQIAWGPEIHGDLEFIHTLSYARSNWELARSTEAPIDVHVWRFTPTSFRLLISELRTIGLTHFDIKNSFDTAGCEFFVTLTKNGNVSDLEKANRMELLKSLREDELFIG